MRRSSGWVFAFRAATATFSSTVVTSHGTVEPAVVTPDAGHLDLVDVAKGAWELGVPKELLPFCESNGDYYCLKPGGRLVYWSHDGAADESWLDLAHWIQGVWIEEEEADE